MIGSIVNHPLFGRGQVVELRNAAREAAVRFDNGIRAVVPVSILSILQAADTPAPAPHPVVLPRAEAAPTPEQQQKISARRTIEALRYGVVPQKRIRELSAGLESERASLTRAFDEVAHSGGKELSRELRLRASKADQGKIAAHLGCVVCSVRAIHRNSSFGH